MTSLLAVLTLGVAAGPAAGAAMADGAAAAVGATGAAGPAATRAAFAADQEVAPSPPRIGLVLSGGGARGAAHVGVLKVLEEQGVPIHAIAGTSMGAIVAGLYAAGWTPGEIEEQLAAVDWPLMFTDRLPRGSLSFRRKTEDRTFLTQFELSVDGEGVRLPVGLVAGHNVGVRLERLLLPAAAVTDFDSLVVPLRLTATDIETGELVVLGSGDLSTAVRASMSLPAIFAPVEHQGRNLVDGGVVRNLPVDVAEAMGVDRLIVVDVGTPLTDQDGVETLLDVSQQLTRLMTDANSAAQREALGPEDLVILPELSGLTTLEFHRWDEAVTAGEDAARSVVRELRAIAGRDDGQATRLAARRRRLRAPRVIDAIRVVSEGGELDERLLRQQMRFEPGQPVDPELLENDLLRMYSLRLFRRINVRIEEGDPGDPVTLVVEAWRKEQAPNSLRFGLSLADDFQEGRSAYRFLTSLWLRRLNGLGGEARFDFQFGEPRVGSVELYQPVAFDGHVFTQARVDHRVSHGSLLVDGSAARYRTAGERGWVEAGIHVSNLAELRLGLLRGQVDADPEDPVFPSLSTDYGAYTATFTADYLDDAAFPRRGGLARISWMGYRRELGTEAPYDRVEATFAQAIPAGRRSLIVGLSVGTRSTGAPPHDPARLGGLFRLSNREVDGLVGRYAAVARLIYLHRLEGGRVHLGASMEAGNVWQERSAIRGDELLYAGSLLAGVRTLVGPVYLAVGLGEAGSPRVYASIGRRITDPW